MFKVIKAIVDDGIFFETLKDHAKSVITGFARFNGRPVGIWANQPMVAAGDIDVDAADKGARFVRFCDLFNIPVVTLGDRPGVPDRFGPGLERNFTTRGKTALCLGGRHHPPDFDHDPQVICRSTLRDAG